MGIFHRYSSEIHGDYRRAYLRCGLLSGLLLAAYVLVRLLMGNPVESPVSLVTDLILLVLLFLLTAWYRNSLPEKKITLKEAMLFGIGTAVVAGLVFGLALWFIGLSSASQTELFTRTMIADAQLPLLQYPLSYWAAWWAIVAAVSIILLGSFGAFLASIFFRNEKSAVKQTKQSNKQ